MRAWNAYGGRALVHQVWRPRCHQQHGKLATSRAAQDLRLLQSPLLAPTPRAADHPCSFFWNLKCIFPEDDQQEGDSSVPQSHGQAGPQSRFQAVLIQIPPQHSVMGESRP